MDKSKGKTRSGHGNKLLNPFAVMKPKKRSLVERELETNMTARMTSPVSAGDRVSTSQYGRARRMKTENDNSKNSIETLMSPKSLNTPNKVQSPIRKLVVNPPCKTETPKKALEALVYLTRDDNICQENNSLSRFNNQEVQSKTPSAKKFSKVYIRKDLIQTRDDDDDDIIMIKDLFSPKSGRKQKKPDRSSKKHNFIKQNGHHIDNASVVKTLDFDANKRDFKSNKRDFESNKRDSEGNKRKKENKVERPASKNDEVEGSCPYQVGDLAWARMGTFPFWPCIITRDPATGMFVRKKLFGRVEHDIIHVTFFADNGRRSWIVDNMLRHYKGLQEFMSIREKFTPEDKKKDPRLFAAFFISDKKQSLWNTSVEEAETINREPKEQRVDVFNDILYKARASKKQLRSGKITRTDSDVSLSESLYDSLFSEDDSKTDDSNRLRNKKKNKSLDVSDVVTACLDNMAAKTGNIKIQRQSHMDRWLQKAKSKTPEKIRTKIEQILPKTPILTPKIETVVPIDKVATTNADKITIQNIQKVLPTVEKSKNNKKKKLPTKEVKITKVYSLRRSYESQNALVTSDSEFSKKPALKHDEIVAVNLVSENMDSTSLDNSKIIVKVECIADTNKKVITNDSLTVNLIAKHEDDNVDDVLNALNELLEDAATRDCNAVSKPCQSTEETDKEINTETQERIQVDELEAMDVDECQDIKVQVRDELAGITDNHVIIDSPDKTEKESSSVNENMVNDSSPVKIENDSSMETRPEDNPNLESTEKIERPSKDTNQTSPSLKRNEMVSIPEDSNMTDDESNSMTETVYNREIIDQDHNSNLTKICSKKDEILDLAEKVTNEKTDDINKIEKEVISIENIFITKPHVSNEKNYMSIDGIIETNIKIKEKDQSGQSASILTIDNESGEKDLLNQSDHSASILLVDNDFIEKDLLYQSGQSASILIDNESGENNLLNQSDHLASILLVENDFSAKNLPSQSGQSASILQVDNYISEFANETPDVNKETSISHLNNVSKSESVLATCENEVLEPVLNSIEMKSDENTAPSNSDESKPFLEESHKIDCVNLETINQDHFFREVNMNKPPDLTSDSLAAKAELLQNIQNSDTDYEDSDEEPSPEYEPLGDEITEDFRQHMICIETSLTDKKDEAQLVKVCNDIAIIEESKTKLADIKTRINKNSSNKCLINNSNTLLGESQRVEEEKIKEELGEIVKHELENSCKANEQSNEKSKKCNENRNGEVKTENIEIDLTKTTDDEVSKDIKAEILDGLDIIKKSVENSLKSPTDKKKHKLSLKKNQSKSENIRQNDTKDSIVLNDDTINPRYKTIDQIEEIMRNKPKRLPLENGEVCIPEINENGYPSKREKYTPDIKDDDDFDIDEASVSSEDSEVSLPQSKIPARRSLRSRPEKKGGLEDPEFLTYMELRQDDLMEEHPELSRDDIVLYLFKTYTYAHNLNSDTKLEESPAVPSVKQETPTPSRRKTKTLQVQPKNTIENFFREKYNNAKKIDFERSESASTSESNEDTKPKREMCTISPVDSGIGNSKDSNESDTPVAKRKTKSKSPKIDLTPEITKEVKVELINNIVTQEDSPKTPKRSRKKTSSPRVLTSHSKTLTNESSDKRVPVVVISPLKDERILDIKSKHNAEPKLPRATETKQDRVAEVKHEQGTEFMDSDSELPLRQLRSKVIQENKVNDLKNKKLELKDEIEDTTSVSSDNEPLLKLIPKKADKNVEGSYEDPDFLIYLELKQDPIMDSNPQLSYNEIKAYLYKTWIYEKGSKSEIQTNDDIVSSNLVKGLNQEPAPQRKLKRKPKTEKNTSLDEIIPKEKPKRKTVSRYYNEEFISDIEDELEVFEIFKTKNTSITAVSKPDSPRTEANTEIKTEEVLKTEVENISEEINTLDEIELYFKQLTSSKPSVFKGLIREKVCEICEDISNLIKCKGCNGTFHYDCVNKATEEIETPTSLKGRKKKKKRKPKNLDDAENSDERNDVSEENISMEEIESITIDADTLESQIEDKMKELLNLEPLINYDSYSSDDGIDWVDTVPGKCEIIDVKLKPRSPPIDYTNFKCNNCQKHDTPVCFVCKSAVSKSDVKVRQKCNVAHCNNYYHLQCLDHWPQTQFNAGEWTRSNKKANEQFEALTCPRHVCHTCVSDDPRGCKTRFSGDKLARCVRCPATYHSFNKCLPAGTQILTASLIICPRHYEHRPGKVPCHVNTGWCFICALGGSLICCEYCPTSFHAECLKIKPPEGNYMCEDCETGRLPLYGEMVWVKLGHYRWWPGVILHPSEIPDNIMAVKHGLGEFVVRFFGQYDHYWVNRGRVFPYQEGDSGRISSQKSKIDAAFTTAMEHAQRAFEILKNAVPDEEESLDIASSLLPPHYVKLKSNKPIGSLLGRKIEDPSLSLTQCECNPAEEEPCGANSQCLNRVLLTECGPTCRAGERCNNRAFEKRQYPKLTPYRAPHRGWGLKTLQDIKAGQFVIEYVGELIDEEEFQRRMRRKHEIRDENFYFLTLDKERMIDAGPKGNLARFMNHCCEPNTETQKWTVLGDIRVGLFAIDDIKANSEVTFNYNFECTGIEKKRCLCGAKRCSGYIGAKPKQLDESQRKKNGMLTGKRKYTKRKNIGESPSSKNKVKKPVGRPPKPKELTEIEKDLLIIKSATVSSDESSKQSIEEKRPTDEVPISNEKNDLVKVPALKSNLDSNTISEVPISNGVEASEPLKRKFSEVDSITSEKVSISSTEPSAKRLKCDKQIEVGD